jgi:hypothetical protein
VLWPSTNQSQWRSYAHIFLLPWFKNASNGKFVFMSVAIEIIMKLQRGHIGNSSPPEVSSPILLRNILIYYCIRIRGFSCEEEVGPRGTLSASSGPCTQIIEYLSSKASSAALCELLKIMFSIFLSCLVRIVTPHWGGSFVCKDEIPQLKRRHIGWIPIFAVYIIVCKSQFLTDLFPSA